MEGDRVKSKIVAMIGARAGDKIRIRSEQGVVKPKFFQKMRSDECAR